MSHKRQSRPKCVGGWEVECALEGAGRQVRALHVRASAQDPPPEMRGRQVCWKCAHMQGRNVPWRAWEVGSCYARARKCTGPPAGDAWKAGSLEVRARAGTGCALQGPGGCFVLCMCAQVHRTPRQRCVRGRFAGSARTCSGRKSGRRWKAECGYRP